MQTAVATKRVTIGSGAPAVARVGEAGPAPTAEALPAVFALASNYPNPFNPSTEIRFALPEATHVRLSVYDVTGREVARLVDQPMPVGHHRVTWEAGRLASGVYLYRLTVGRFSQVRRMVLQK